MFNTTNVRHLLMLEIKHQDALSGNFWFSNEAVSEVSESLLTCSAVLFHWHDATQYLARAVSCVTVSLSFLRGSISKVGAPGRKNST